MFIGALNTESDLNEMLLIKRKRNSTYCTVEQNFASYPKMITMITVHCTVSTIAKFFNIKNLKCQMAYLF